MAKALPTTQSLPNTDEDPTLQENRAKVRRMGIDMSSADYREFGDQARDKGMTMRRYFYWLWDKHTGDKRSVDAFDD